MRGREDQALDAREVELVVKPHVAAAGHPLQLAAVGELVLAIRVQGLDAVGLGAIGDRRVNKYRRLCR